MIGLSTCGLEAGWLELGIVPIIAFSTSADHLPIYIGRQRKHCRCLNSVGRASRNRLAAVVRWPDFAFWGTPISGMLTIAMRVSLPSAQAGHNSLSSCSWECYTHNDAMIDRYTFVRKLSFLLAPGVLLKTVKGIPYFIADFRKYQA